MSRIRKIFLGGLMVILALPALASNGNPRIMSSNPGAGNAAVFVNHKPCQDDSASVPSIGLYLLSTPSNYFVDTAAYPGWTKYGITSTPPAPTTTAGYLLVKDGASRYAIVGFNLGSPVGPADQAINPIKYYKTGKPTAPTALAAEAGFETAKLSWQLDTSNYEYSSIDLTIVRVSDGVVIPASGGVQTTTINGAATSYILGELIDGRILVSGTQYRAELAGKVKAKADGSLYYISDPATATFTMLSGGGSVSSTITLGPGMNVFSLGVPSNSGGKWKFVVGGESVEKQTIQDLISSINEILAESSGPIKRISTFGYVVSGESGAVEGVRWDGSAYTGTAGFLQRNLNATQGYQAYIMGLSAGQTITLTVSNQ